MDKEKIALIPAYEPDMRLAELARSMCGAGFVPVIVDDGSGEGCREVFRAASEYGAVLTHEENRGKGRALKTGFAYISEHYGEACTVVTMDCDGQHTVDDAVRLCGHAMAHTDSLVLGSRGLDENVPLRSRFGNSVTRGVYHLVTGLSVHDTQTGLRAFDGGLLPWLSGIKGERYEYEMNVLLACARRKVPVQEITIDTIYIDGNSGSHFNTFRDSYRIYKEILKFSASSFASFLIDYGLYSLIVAISGNLTAANVGARAVSASVNYTLNRKLVFDSDARVAKSALQYAALAAAILAGNTLVLNMLVSYLGVNEFAAKLITELIFFMVSWLVQRGVIFRKKQAVGGGAGCDAQRPDVGRNIMQNAKHRTGAEMGAMRANQTWEV